MSGFTRVVKKLAIVALAGLPAVALAAGPIGHALPGQIGFIPADTTVARDIHVFHNDLLMPIITLISLFVLALLIYVGWRFGEKRHPVPTRTTHNTMLEMAWTVIPILILVVIAVPSFKLLTNQLTLPKPDITMKVTGHQWYWSYDYPKSEGGFSFDSLLIPDNKIDTTKGQLRLLSVDNPAVVPVGKTILVQVTGADVIHSFTVPSFGIRIDAIPGRLNETWFKAEHRGTYYGECSNICGQNHAFMPIEFKVVSVADYKAWLLTAKKQFAMAGQNPVQMAAAAAVAAH